MLPDRLSGKPTRLDDEPDGVLAQLAPASSIPPILVGGMSDAAMIRTVEHGDGWFLLPVPPAAVAQGRARLAELAAARGRPMPSITAGLMIAITGDPALPDHDALIGTLTDTDGVFGIPVDVIPDMLVNGPPADVAARLAALAEAGAERVVVSVAAGDWSRQTGLLAEAGALLN